MFYVLFGGFLLGSTILLDTLVADLIAYGKTKLKKERLYFGILKVMIKFSSPLSAIFSGLVLTIIQFDSQNITQILEQKIAYIYGIFLGSFFILSSLIIFWFQYAKIKHQKVII